MDSFFIFLIARPFNRQGFVAPSKAHDVLLPLFGALGAVCDPSLETVTWQHFTCFIFCKLNYLKKTCLMLRYSSKRGDRGNNYFLLYIFIYILMNGLPNIFQSWFSLNVVRGQWTYIHLVYLQLRFELMSTLSSWLAAAL